MYNNLPKVSPNSMTARVFLAFLTSAGLFYVNIMPTIVSGLIEALGFTNQQAGISPRQICTVQRQAPCLSCFWSNV